MFEMFLGWQAILFEPSRTSYPNLLNASSFNMAACAHEQTVTFAESGSLAVSGMERTMSNSFWNAWHDGKNVTKYQVLCAPLDKYLKLIGAIRIGAIRIDAFFLDVEGAELEALKGIDLNNLTFHYIVIEADGSASHKVREIKNTLTHHGYEFVGKVGEGRNDFYVNKHW